MYFDEARAHVEKHYGKRVADWPQVRIVLDPEVCEQMHKRFWNVPCWNCGYVSYRNRNWPEPTSNALEAHHIAGGAQRSDEYCNIAMLNSSCHKEVKTKKLPQGRILYLKWKHDRANTDWVRLTLLGRRFLPPLVLDDGTHYQ